MSTQLIPTQPSLHSRDPVELIVAGALTRAGIPFVHESRDKDGVCLGLDFYLPATQVHIEVTRFYTPRKIEQMNRAPSVILIQGLQAAQAFAAMLAKTAPDQPAAAAPPGREKAHLCPLCSNGRLRRSAGQF